MAVTRWKLPWATMAASRLFLQKIHPKSTPTTPFSTSSAVPGPVVATNYSLVTGTRRVVEKAEFCTR